LIISAQWSDIISKIKSDIDEAIKAEQELLEPGEVWIDPRNIIPVIDTSGSMVNARVQDIAIGLGILATHLSSMPGCLISFSDVPKVFNLDMSGASDVFDHFKTILKGPMGFSTNIDATYRILLDLMVKSQVKETDFALLLLTDTQFDAIVKYPSCDRVFVNPERPKSFLIRLEEAFKKEGYNLPRTIFWNLNGSAPGFQATTFMKGAQLVSGYSQSLMIQVFTGNFKYEQQEDGTQKVNVDPWSAFLKALQHEGYDPVSMVGSHVGEGCLKLLDMSV
jgi:hypothetical protein